MTDVGRPLAKSFTYDDTALEYQSRFSRAVSPSNTTQLHQKFVYKCIKTATSFTGSINCFFARKSSLKWLFVGNYRIR